MDGIEEVLVNRSEELAACCADLAKAGPFGFDTEFIGEQTYHPELCLIQVATNDHLFLIDPLSVGPLDAFWKLVVDPAQVKVVHAGREEVRLCKIATGQPPANLFDLQLAAGLAGLTYPIGHGNLVSQLLRVQLSKGETLTDWRSRPLTHAQVRYAFDDVRYLLPLYKKLSSRLESSGRLDWAREEFTRLASLADPEEEATQEKWRKLRGLGSLDRKRLNVVRALFQWREETAARTNRPIRSICRDDLLIEIARKNPQKDRDLDVIRGLPKRDLPAIVRVVIAAQEQPPEQWPVAMERDQDTPQVTLVGALLNAVLADLCLRLGLAQSLVASTNDVRQLVRANQNGVQPSSDLLVANGWRGTHILPELLAVLEGRRLVRVADVAAEAPLGYENREMNAGQPSADSP